MSKQCDHVWMYLHTIYSGVRGGTAVRRFCHHCDCSEVGNVTRWRNERPDEFDHPADDRKEHAHD